MIVLVWHGNRDGKLNGGKGAFHFLFDSRFAIGLSVFETPLLIRPLFLRWH